MPTETATLIPLADWAAAFMLFVARFSPIAFLMPGIGEQVIPARIKLQFMLALAFIFTAAGVIPPVSFTPFESYLEMMLAEVVLGLLLGFCLRVVIWVLSICGSIIAQSIGISQFMGVAIEHEAQTITSNLLVMAGVVILLSADYHVSVIVSLVEMYENVPPGDIGQFEYMTLSASIFQAFNFAVLLAWPFVAVNLIYNICLGFINKALPQLMVAFVGAPFLVGAGLFLLAVSIGALLMVWQERIMQLIVWL